MEVVAATEGVQLRFAQVWNDIFCPSSRSPPLYETLNLESGVEACDATQPTSNVRSLSVYLSLDIAKDETNPSG